MGLNPVSYRPVGIIHSALQVKEKIPTQPICAQECLGRTEILPEFLDGLRDGSTLHFRGCDILDGTPLLDIKPCTRRFDHIAVQRRWRRKNSPTAALRPLLRCFDVRKYASLLDNLAPCRWRFVFRHLIFYFLRKHQRNGWQNQVSDQTAGQRGLRDYQESNGCTA